MPQHESHITRISDASSFDEICINCGATDEIGSWGQLEKPCPKPVGAGGISYKEWAKKDREQVKM